MLRQLRGTAMRQGGGVNNPDKNGPHPYVAKVCNQFKPKLKCLFFYLQTS